MWIHGRTRRWRVDEGQSSPERGDAGRELSEALDVHPLVGKLLMRRDVSDAPAARQFLEPKVSHLHDPARLPGAVRAAQRIVHALRAREPIVIYGDYDVDGVTATSILYHTLKTADPEADVRRYIPHRIDEGYGINRDAIQSIIDGGAKLIVSVDCGITAVEPARAARERGADLIITDHHEPPETLPDAHTLVHPRLREGDKAYPFGDICGAGVAYKLAWQIARTWCGSERVSQTFRELLVDLMSLAALGTIADVVPLVDENRALARFGLGRIKHTPFAGVNALIDAANLRDEKIDSYHVGFILGPRLNACGRMGHAKRAVHLLTTAAPEEALQIARYLNSENERRRGTEREILEQAKGMIEQHGYHHEQCRSIVLAHEDWHPGVVGIVCSRLVETFGRPTVLLQTVNGEAHGSARSIEGFNIHEAFSACAQHLESFGGHAMAAGLRLRTDGIETFREAMRDYAGSRIDAEQLTPSLNVDAEAALSELQLPVVEQIRRLEPFGRANPEPVLLVRGATLVQPARAVGREGKHLSMTIRQEGHVSRCIAWRMGELAEELSAGGKLDLVCSPRINQWRGERRVDLHVKDLRVGV